MTIDAVFAWLEGLPYAVAIHESDYLFPTIETIHVFALTLVVGSIAMLDLKLIGVASRDRAVSEVAEQVLPWTWSAFLVAATSGFLLFSSSAVKYWAMYVFRAKLVLLLLAGGNMMIFHIMVYSKIADWDNRARLPRAARIAGGLSLTLWILVVVCGRWLGFVGGPPPT